VGTCRFFPQRCSQPRSGIFHSESPGFAPYVPQASSQTLGTCELHACHSGHAVSFATSGSCWSRLLSGLSLTVQCHRTADGRGRRSSSVDCWGRWGPHVGLLGPGLDKRSRASVQASYGRLLQTARLGAVGTRSGNLDSQPSTSAARHLRSLRRMPTSNAGDGGRLADPSPAVVVGGPSVARALRSTARASHPPLVLRFSGLPVPSVSRAR
jgi:hypothetical protein